MVDQGVCNKCLLLRGKLPRCQHVVGKHCAVPVALAFAALFELVQPKNGPLGNLDDGIADAHYKKNGNCCVKNAPKHGTRAHQMIAHGKDAAERAQDHEHDDGSHKQAAHRLLGCGCVVSSLHLCLHRLNSCVWLDCCCLLAVHSMRQETQCQTPWIVPSLSGGRSRFGRIARLSSPPP